MTPTSRRTFLAGLCSTPLGGASQSKSKPNILVFMTDQESALLPGPIHRPAHDTLRRRGVEFTNAFCNTPQCSPARAALLTGLEPHHAGVLTNVDGSSLGKPLNPAIPTIAKVFRDAGYSTGYFGKWHLGNEASPLEPHGFTTYVRGKDEVVSTAAADWIRGRTEPWLAWVSVLNPHDIYEIVDRIKSVAIRPGVRPPATSAAPHSLPPAQQKYMTEDQGKPTLAYTTDDWLRYRSLYCSLVEKADACLNTVLGAVADPGKTITLYTADHGDALGEHGLPFKGPFLYEPLIHIPLVIAAPGLKPGSLNHSFATSSDLAPTLASLAGVAWPSVIDGKDVLRESTRDAVFLEYYGKQRWVAPIRTIRTRRWKLSQYSDGAAELYDLQKDSIESQNLAGTAAAAAEQQRLQVRLDQWWPGIRQ